MAGIQQAALAQLGERQTEDLKVPGSIPGGGIFSVVSIYGLVGYDVCLTRRRSPVRSWVDVFLARCGPRGVMETRLPPKEKIVGSSPTGGVPKVLWCNWLALRTLNPAIRVQIPVGPPFCLRGDRAPGDRAPAGGRGKAACIAWDTLAEWLRRVIRNHMGSSRAGSNPAGVADFVLHQMPSWPSGLRRST